MPFGAQALLSIIADLCGTEGGYMRKAATMNEKVERGGLRLFAVVALAGTLTALGCTTNRTPGNGQPTSSGPALGPAAPATPPGSSSGTAGETPPGPPPPSNATPPPPPRR